MTFNEYKTIEQTVLRLQSAAMKAGAQPIVTGNEPRLKAMFQLEDELCRLIQKHVKE
jgi:hypothetical protein